MSKAHEDWGWAERFPSRKSTWSPADAFFPDKSPFGHMGSNPIARKFGARPFQGIGDGLTYSTLDWTVTTTGTSAAAAADVSGGVLLTSGSTSTFNTNLQSITNYTPGAGVGAPASDVGWIAGGWILQSSSITAEGFDVGFGASTVAPQNADYTDTISFRMAVGAGTIVGRVRGDSGTAASTATLFTATAATDLFLGFYASLGKAKRGILGTTVTTGASSATQTVGSTAGMAVGDLLYFGGATKLWRVVSSITNATTVVVNASISTTTADAVTQMYVQGQWWAGATYQTAVVTPFTANQLIQLAQILSTPVAMYHNICATGSAGNPTVLVKAAHLERDYV